MRSPFFLYIGILTIFVIFSEYSSAKSSQISLLKSESCSFKCKYIPPLAESLISWGGTSRSNLDANSIHVLVWNLYKGRNEMFETEMRAFMKNADIALFQEVSLDNKMTPLFNSFEGFSGLMSVSFIMTDDSATGVSTLSIVDAIAFENQRTTTKEPFSKSPKANMIAFFPLSNGKRLLTINIHGMNRRSTEVLQSQYEMVESHLENHDGPIIFAGDFNTRNSSRQSMTDKWMAKFGLERADFANDGRGKKKLDHFYSRGLTIKFKKLHEGILGSDHPAIEITASAN